MEKLYETLSCVNRTVYIEHIILKEWIKKSSIDVEYVFITDQTNLDDLAESTNYYLIDFDYCETKTQTLRMLYRRIRKGKVLVLSSSNDARDNYLVASIFNVHAFLIKDTLKQQDFLIRIKPPSSSYS